MAGVTKFIPEDTKPELTALLKLCLSMRPEKRPNFEEIVPILESMTDIVPVGSQRPQVLTL